MTAMRTCNVGVDSRVVIAFSGWVGILGLGCGGDVTALPAEQTGTMQQALRPSGPPPLPPPPTKTPSTCSSQVPEILSFAATRAEVTLGDTTILSWQVKIPNRRCGYSVNVAGQAVSPEGTLTVQPVSSESYALQVLQFDGTAESVWDQVTVPVQVDLPNRNLVTISSQQDLPLFVQALRTEYTTVVVNADLDLTGLASPITITNGVTLKGTRSAAGQPFQSGPLLFVTDHPDPLFDIVGDNVRVTGLRFQGPSMAADGTTAMAMSISDVMPDCSTYAYPGSPCGTFPGHVNVEIDNNEFAGWTDTALGVGDAPNRIVVPVTVASGAAGLELDYYANPSTEPVWIHDNFIHHNLHNDTDGYGVSVGAGAHALIERNVFDSNRHAITSGHNDPRVGYRAYRNLVLPEHGTGDQQFDVHGSDPCPLDDPSCWPHVGSTSWWRGVAGHDFDIRYNAFLYKDGPAFLLRGTPSLGLPLGAVVEFNVFAHGNDVGDAVQWTEDPGPTIRDNVSGRTSYDEVQTCDFDGDGINDRLVATGQTLWYCPGQSDGVTAPGTGKPTWVYLNSSTKPLSALSLGYFRGTSVCDIVDNGWISAGGTGPWLPLVPLTRPPSSQLGQNAGSVQAATANQ
jgi:hypothetical protein